MPIPAVASRGQTLLPLARLPVGPCAPRQPRALSAATLTGKASWCKRTTTVREQLGCLAAGGELVAGDGFPQQGSEIVTRCVLGVFYGDVAVSRQDVVSQATTVDGKDAWVTEMHLGFSIKGLNETGETAIIVIVATSDESSSLYYASIPDSRPELLATARAGAGTTARRTLSLNPPAW